jgi:hypothetical protein
MWLDHSRRFPDPHQNHLPVEVDQRGPGRVVILTPQVKGLG